MGTTATSSTPMRDDTRTSRRLSRSLTQMHGRGIGFWPMFVGCPSIVLLMYSLFRFSSSSNSRVDLFDEDNINVTLAEIAEWWLVTTLAVGSLQLPAYTWWYTWVEGYVGFPRWVHKAIGLIELVIVVTKLFATSNVHVQVMCNMIAVLIAGGAVFAWLWVARDPAGLIPASLLLTSVVFAPATHNVPILVIVCLLMLGTCVAMGLAWVLDGRANKQH